jgi:hypothetical protein
VFAERWHLLDSSSSDGSDGCTLHIRCVHAMSCLLFLAAVRAPFAAYDRAHEAVRPPARITRLPVFDVNLLTPRLVGIRKAQTVEWTPRTLQYVFT